MSDKIIRNWNNQYPLNNFRQSIKTKVNYNNGNLSYYKEN